MPTVGLNLTSEVRSIDVASGQIQNVAMALLGEVNGITRDGAYVLLIRNITWLPTGRYDRQLIRRNLANGQETVLVASGDIQYARLLPGDAQALVVIDAATSPNTNDYRFGTITLSGGTIRPLGGTGPGTQNVAVHPDVRR